MHALLIAVYHMLRSGELYHPPIVHPNAERKQRKCDTERIITQLEKLGRTVTLQTSKSTSTSEAAVEP
jgi:hypothetical protein